MSLPDHLLDEPDPLFCQEHMACFPCLACQADEADRRMDSIRDDKEAS